MGKPQRVVACESGDAGAWALCRMRVPERLRTLAQSAFWKIARLLYIPYLIWMNLYRKEVFFRLLASREVNFHNNNWIHVANPGEVPPLFRRHQYRWPCRSSSAIRVFRAPTLYPWWKIPRKINTFCKQFQSQTTHQLQFNKIYSLKAEGAKQIHSKIWKKSEKIHFSYWKKKKISIKTSIAIRNVLLSWISIQI